MLGTDWHATINHEHLEGRDDASFMSAHSKCQMFDIQGTRCRDAQKTVSWFTQGHSNMAKCPN